MKNLYFLDKKLSHIFNEFDSFERIKDMDGEIFRKYERRITKRFQVNEKNYFIKFHGPVGWKEILKNIFQIKTPVIGAQREYEALNHLAKRGIQCPEIKGFGKKGLNPANSSSFLITEELYETVSLEDFFLQGLYKELTKRQKINLIKKSASLIRSMHLSGLNHRDLYLCHIHIKNDPNFIEPELYLIDLHRAQIRSKVPIRWVVKDLGGFFHSCIQFGFSERDFYRFMMTYYECSFASLITNHFFMIEKILDRAFKMYLAPALRNLSENTSTSNEDRYAQFQKNSRRCFIDKNFDFAELSEYLFDENLLIGLGEVIKNEKGHLIVKVKKEDKIFYIKKYRIKNLLHGISRLFKRTRAYNSCVSTLWLNAAGIKTAKILLLLEKKGFLGSRDSFLVTEGIKGERLDRLLELNADLDVFPNIVAFFKRMNWIRFSHGDVKTSNFFLNETGLITFDLDSSKRRFFKFSHEKAISKDKRRILKSIKNHGRLHMKLSKTLLGN